MKEYTVIGLYPNATTDFPHPRDGSWVEDVTADSIDHAIAKAIRSICENVTEFEPDDLAVLAVFEGKHIDVWEGP